MTEFSRKQKQLRKLLELFNLDAIILQRASSFAWATCGAASYINTASTNGEASLLITASSHHLITNNIEATRLQQEEKLNYQGWQFHTNLWYQPQTAIAELTRGLRIGTDGFYPGAIDLSAQIAYLRANLTPEEGVRFRVLGRLCAEAMDATAHAIHPGQTEHQIAAHLAQETLSRGVQAIVNLIATDERIYSFRHPLPTYKALNRYAMLVFCGRRWGLVCSLSRLIHFGKLPDDLRHKQEAITRIDATLIGSTRPGQKLSTIFKNAQEAYQAQGYPEEWQLHHQGGATGYEPREYLGSPTPSEYTVQVDQVYAWNPSITGIKSEDTIQVGEQENEILTAIPGWPTMPVEYERKTYQRPAILIIT